MKLPLMSPSSLASIGTFAEDIPLSNSINRTDRAASRPTTTAPMSDNDDYLPDYSKYDEDSVPPPEKEIQHTHPNRPDIDYDDTPVGPADTGDFKNNEDQEDCNKEDSK